MEEDVQLEMEVFVSVERQMLVEVWKGSLERLHGKKHEKNE